MNKFIEALKKNKAKLNGKVILKKQMEAELLQDDVQKPKKKTKKK